LDLAELVPVHPEWAHLVLVHPTVSQWAEPEFGVGFAVEPGVGFGFAAEVVVLEVQPTLVEREPVELGMVEIVIGIVSGRVPEKLSPAGTPYQFVENFELT